MINIFVSFREIDRDHREGFEGTLQNPESPLRGYPLSSRKDIRAEGEDAVKAYIREKMQPSDIIIVLIGDDSHNSKWIDYEMDLATTWQKPIFGVRINGTRGNGPTLFVQRNLEILDWDVSIIATKIDELAKS